MTRIARAASLAACLTGCFGAYHNDSPDAARDATSDRSDAMTDLGVDRPITVDAPLDASTDVLLDAPVDLARDTPDAPDVTAPDAPEDLPVAPDATALDAAVDAPADVTPDARADAALDGTADVAFDVSADTAADADLLDPTIEAPRLLEPLSAMRVLRRVRFGWANAPGADGALIDVCRDRACASVELTVSVTGDTLTTTSDLTPGYHFWRARGRRGRAVGAAFSTVWELYVTPRRAGFVAPLPRQWGAMPDVNADGRADLLAGAPNTVATGGRTGAVYLFTGVTDRFNATAATPLVTALGTGSFGRRVSPVADVNGDGYADVVVDAASVVALFHGSPSGLPSTPTRVYDAWRTATGAGDINHDGYGDVVVCDGSRVGVLLGGAGGTASAPVRTLGGSSAVSIGDVNSDGYDDLAVQTATSRLGVFLGNLAGVDSVATYSVDMPAGYTFSGPALAGDVNADGVADVIATASPVLGTITSAVVFPLAPPGMRVMAPVFLTSPSPRAAGFGTAVAGAGDFNGDGVDDLIVGSGGGGAVEAVCVYPGSATGVGTTATQCLTMTAATRFGASVGGVGDLNADGFEDVVVGATGSSTVRGVVTLYRGRAAGLTDSLIAPYSAGEIAGALGTDVGGWR
jgi:FG-GAP-like repeat